MAIRPVPQRFPGAALSGTQTQLLGSLAFPDAGGVQAVDKTGAVFDLVSSTGSLIPSADNVDDVGSATLRWRYGYFASGVVTTGIATLVSGAIQPSLITNSVASAVNVVAVTGAATAVSPSISAQSSLDANVSLKLFGRGTGGVQVRGSNDAATIFGVQSVASGNYAPTMWASNDSGTPGNATINRPSGQVAVAIGAASVTVTNDLVTATSIVICTLQFIDATFTQILSVVPGAGSFVITGNATATAATKIGFIVINPSATVG